MSAVATKGEIKNLAARPGGGKTTTQRVAREKILARLRIVTILTQKPNFLAFQKSEMLDFLVGWIMITESPEN